MTKLATTLVVVLLMVNPAWAQDKKRFSDGLTIAGLTTVLVGAVLMVPMDDPTAKSYYFEGAGSYCADTNTSNGNVSVTKGGCSDLPAMRTAGLITMGVGGVLTLIGMHKVSVSPQVGHKALGGRVSVKW